jgi:hypothetical protein
MLAFVPLQMQLSLVEAERCSLLGLCTTVSKASRQAPAQQLARAVGRFDCREDPMTTDVVLSDGAELWRALASRAGLQPTTYDDDVITDVRLALGLPGSVDIELALMQAGTPAAAVLDAVLAALSPFAQMMIDLLALYERAGASSAAGDNLRIEYDFAEGGDTLAFDLSWFRDAARRWRSVTGPVPVVEATVGDLWAFEAALRPGRERLQAAPAVTPLTEMYDRGLPWVAEVPQPPVTGAAELDRVLEEVHEFAGVVLELSRRHSTGPESLRGSWDQGRLDDSVDPMGSESGSLSPLAFLHSDRWLETVASDLLALAGVARRRPKDCQQIAESVAASLAGVPRGVQLREQRVQELFELLSLPVWGRRHELYSAWLLTLILDALPEEDVVVHVSNGRLVFAFSGTHVASVNSGKGRLELWAELRHPYATPIGKGRRRAIQPDYTLAAAPITMHDCAVLVVEAKQYLSGKKRNFLDALTDYVGGHQRAQVVLANYGSIPVSVTERRIDRALPLAHVRPGNDGPCVAFKLAVAAAVPPPERASEGAPQTRPPTEDVRSDATPRVAALVTLEWARGGDLDLHLVQQPAGTITSYRTIGLTESGRTVELWNDDRTGPGRENALVLSGAGQVQIWVNRFSSEVRLPECEAQVSITRRRATQLVERCPRWVADDPWWFVGVLDEDGTFQHAADVVRPSPPG